MSVATFPAGSLMGGGLVELAVKLRQHRGSPHSASVPGCSIDVSEVHQWCCVMLHDAS